jgi:DNA modification methylase
MKPYYVDDFVALYHGDCRKITEWLAADVLVTDPPYGIAWKKGNNKRAGSRPHAGIRNDEDTAARDEILASWGDKPAAVFGSLYAPFPANHRQALIWRKPPDAGVVGSVTGWRRDVELVFLTGSWPQRTARWSSVLDSGARMVGGTNAPAARYGHPHAKPLDLMENLIASCPPGTIADPFAGSGSTLVAAKLQGRRTIGVELEERYCAIAAERLAQDALPSEKRRDQSVAAGPRPHRLGPRRPHHRAPGRPHPPPTHPC